MSLVIVPNVSPTVLRWQGYRLYFFSREEARLHVHVWHSTGEAKFWMEPGIELAYNYGMTAHPLTVAERLVREHEAIIRTAWQAHFGR